MPLPSPIPHPRSTFDAGRAAAIDRVVGSDWPEGDERALRTLSDQWHEAAKLVGPLLEDAGRAVSGAVAAFGGAGTRQGEALQRLWDKTGGSIGAEAFEELGRLAAAGARIIEAAKLEIYTLIAQMLADLDTLGAVSATSLGMAAAGAEPVIVAARRAVTRVLDKAINELNDLGSRAAAAHTGLGQFSFGVPMLAEQLTNTTEAAAGATGAAAAAQPVDGGDVVMAYGIGSFGAATGVAAMGGAGGSRGTALRGRFGERAVRGGRAAEVLSAVTVNVITNDAAAKWPAPVADAAPRLRQASPEATAALSSLDNPKLASASVTAEPMSKVPPVMAVSAAATAVATAGGAADAAFSRVAPAVGGAGSAVPLAATGTVTPRTPTPAEPQRPGAAVTSATRAATAAGASSFTLSALAQTAPAPTPSQPSNGPARPQPPSQPQPRVASATPSSSSSSPSIETSTARLASSSPPEVASAPPQAETPPAAEPFLLLMQAQAAAATTQVPSSPEAEKAGEPTAEEYETLIADGVASLRQKSGLARRELPPTHQQALAAGGPEQFGDLRGDWLLRIDAGGPAADPARATISATVAESVVDTWLRGRNRVAEPGTPQMEIDAKLQRLRPDEQGLARVEAALRIEGHGSCAIIVQERVHGERHATTIHNRHGELLHVDAQRKTAPIGTVAPPTRGVIRLDAVAWRADDTPIDLVRADSAPPAG